jgi:hypothetical protein
MATIESMLEMRKGIKKIRNVYHIKSLKGLIDKEAIRVADWNREEVKKRVGDENELFESIAKDYSIGNLLGYWNGHLNKKHEISPTKENPIFISDGGHRLRWVTKILKDSAFIMGHSLSSLKENNPTMYEKILDYSIMIEIATHDSGTVPEDFVKQEYASINIHTEPLTLGEVLRASTNDTFARLQNRLEGALINRKTKMDALVRDKDIAIYRSILAGVMQDFDNMKESKDLVDFPPITDNEETLANSVIDAYGLVEKTLWKKFVDDKDKKTETYKLAKKVLSDNFNYDYHGPMIYGLTKVSDSDRPLRIAQILKFYEISLVDKATWAANISIVKMNTGRNGGNRRSAKRYRDGWNMILSIITPSVPINGDSITGTNIPSQ